MKNKMRYIILSFVLLLSVSVQAANLEINEMRLAKMTSAPGVKVSLFYVSGREPTIGSVGHRLQVDSIVGAPVTVAVGADRAVTFPAVSISRREGFVNYLLFVVHRKGQDEVSIRNPNGKWVPDIRNIANPEEGAQYGDLSLIKIFDLRPNSNSIIEINSSEVFEDN